MNKNILDFKNFVKAYDVVVWDWNGTLLNDAINTHQIISEILTKEGLKPISLDQYRERFGFPIANYYASLGLPSFGGEFDRVAHLFMQYYKEHYEKLNLFKDSVQLLEAVKALSIKQYILSAAKSDELRMMLKKFNVADYFNDVSGANDIYAHGKVDQAKAMKTYFKSQGYSKGLYIGDTDHDMEVSDVLGYDFCFSAEGHQSETRLDPKKIAYVLANRSH